MILGFDLSLNHCGSVCLNADGKVKDYWFISDKKKAIDQGNKAGTKIPAKKKDEDSEQHQLNRMFFYEDWLSAIVQGSQSKFVGVEGYAFAAASNSSYQYGELGGLARKTLAKLDCSVRIHDPNSIKMFSTGKGNATADKMLAVCPDSLKKKWLKIENGLKGQQVAEDLAVAYWIAKLVWTEIELREGRIMLSDLPSEKIRVFNRVTKTYPVNLLDRDWLKKP